MHTGNVSFRPQIQLELAPAYDMLPLLYCYQAVKSHPNIRAAATTAPTENRLDHRMCCGTGVLGACRERLSPRQ
jgi:hypothetical protein